MTRMVQTRRSSLWMLAVMVLVLALALAACGGRGGVRQGGAGGTGNNVTTTQQGSAATSAASSTSAGANASDIESADQQIQGALQGLDGAQSDANQDFSGQDNESVP